MLWLLIDIIGIHIIWTVVSFKLYPMMFKLPNSSNITEDKPSASFVFCPLCTMLITVPNEQQSPVTVAIMSTAMSFVLQL